MMYSVYMCDTPYQGTVGEGRATFEWDQTAEYMQFLLECIDAGKEYYGTASPSESYMLVGLTAEDFD